MRLALLALILAMPLTTTFADPAPVRVAVISDADNKNLAALVTTELSGNPDISLVERNDLAKVGDELKLQQLAGSDSVALGKLIGADGLLFITKTPNGLQVRFTAVGLGYALFDDQVASNEDAAQLAKSISHRVAGYAPKLKLDPAKAIPISVLNLRADYATADSTALERKLTLLLESRLASLPEYVVLERRHAWSLGFERSLDPKSQPLLHGSYVVDGTLGLPLQNRGQGELTIHLRLRSPNNQQTPLEIHGAVNDLPGLVEQMAIEIQKATGANGNLAPWQPQKEAREYLEEGIWGWQHHADEAALEALNSAELMGETAPDLVAIRICLFCRRASDGMEVYGNRDVALPAGNRSLDQRTDDALEAIKEVVRYNDEKMESRLQIFQSSQSLDVRTGELQDRVATLGSQLLVRLDEANSPRADELRQALRSVTGYDPLHGHLGSGLSANPWMLRDVYADEWAGTLQEELAYYHLLLTAHNEFLPPALIGGHGDGFCHRFLHDPVEEKKAFDQLVQSLKDDPAGKPSYFLIQSCSTDDATADAAYQGYLNELWNRRDELVANNEQHVAWANTRAVSDKVRVRNATAVVPLLRYYLAHVNEFRYWEYSFHVMWQPAGWSEQDASAIWPEYLDFKKRVEVAWKAHGSNPEALVAGLDELERPFLKKFPQFAIAGPTPAVPLVLTRFWQPGLAPDAHAERFTIPGAEATTEGICLLGSYHASDNGSALYEISLPDMKTVRINLPVTPCNARDVRVTAQSYYVEYYKDTQQYIGWFDRKTRTWTERAMATVFMDTGFWPVNGTLYFSMEKGGLARYDWDKDQVTLLASPRRKPSQNQLDDQANLRVSGVFAGPGNNPCVAANGGVYYIQDQSGAWRTVFDSDRFSQAQAAQDKTLVWSQNGEVVLLDPAQPAPQYLMASAPTPYRKPSWATEARWDAPERGLASNGNFSNSIGIHGDSLYDLVSPMLLSGTYELLVYSKEGRTPRHIPLKFEMDEATRATLAPIYNNTTQGAPEWTLDKLEHPGSPFFSLRLIATNQGLCLVSYVGGFWFLPYSAIDDYLKTHPVAPSDSGSPKTAQTRTSAGGDTTDPGNSNSFR